MLLILLLQSFGWTILIRRIIILIVTLLQYEMLKKCENINQMFIVEPYLIKVKSHRSIKLARMYVFEIFIVEKINFNFAMRTIVPIRVPLGNYALMIDRGCTFIRERSVVIEEYINVSCYDDYSISFS